MNIFKKNTNPFNIQVGDVIEVPSITKGDRTVMVIEVANDTVGMQWTVATGFKGELFINPEDKSGRLYHGIIDGLENTLHWKSLRDKVKNGEARKIASFGSSDKGVKMAREACKDLNSAIWDHAVYYGAA